MFTRSDENLTMLFDFYEMTMSHGYFEHGMKDLIGYFDMYYRSNPDNGGFAIACGLDSVIDYLNDLHFDPKDIDFLRSKGIFKEDFLTWLKDFRFHGDVWAVPEGSVVFPNEPLITVRAPIIEASLVETMLLLSMNHQSCIASKASRIVRAARGRAIMEFGSRRAQGPDAANLGARAAYIAGCVGTADTLSDQRWGVPALGTMAHSWVMMFPSELDAFKAYAESYPDNCLLLVDTYDTLASGVPNAIRTFDEVLTPMGKRPAGIRLDSGDIAYLSKQARRMLDEAGYPDAKIVASNALDEYRISDILQQEARLDSFGVGENLITSKSDPVFGGVYKLVAVEKDGEIFPKIKISENVEKITTPGFKHFCRFYNKDHKALADLILLKDEPLPDGSPYEIFHPTYTWKRMVLEDYEVRPMHKEIFRKGKLVYDRPSLPEIRDYCQKELHSLWDEYLRFDNPHIYKVDLSREIWDMKHQLLTEVKANTISVIRHQME